MSKKIFVLLALLSFISVSAFAQPMYTGQPWQPPKTYKGENTAWQPPKAVQQVPTKVWEPPKVFQGESRSWVPPKTFPVVEPKTWQPPSTFKGEIPRTSAPTGIQQPGNMDTTKPGLTVPNVTGGTPASTTTAPEVGKTTTPTPTKIDSGTINRPTPPVQETAPQKDSGKPTIIKEPPADQQKKYQYKHVPNKDIPRSTPYRTPSPTIVPTTTRTPPPTTTYQNIIVNPTTTINK